MSEHYIEDENLSVAWAKALKLASTIGKSEIVPLVVSITGFDDDGNLKEHDEIRDLLDSLLKRQKQQTVDTVASTIFPYAMWNPQAKREQLFNRYLKIFPRLKKASKKNNHGIYFERMISGGPASQPNQLEFLLSTYLGRKAVRRSILQVAIFNPSKDHSASAQRGFPCLQHLTFAPVGDKLSVNAFYASQYMVEKAYGNYVGICQLGQFIASELKLKLDRVTIFTGIALCDANKGELAPILKLIE